MKRFKIKSRNSEYVILKELFFDIWYEPGNIGQTRFQVLTNAEKKVIHMLEDEYEKQREKERHAKLNRVYYLNLYGGVQIYDDITKKQIL